MDRGREEIAEGYRLLGRVNKLFRFADPFEKLIPQYLGEEKCRNLTLLDLGAGDGSLARELTQWAAKRGWKWEVTCLDLNPDALQLNPSPRHVVGSALDLPFRDRTFDVVIASQMTHHLPGDDAVARHFREAWRVSREAVVIYDLHRNILLYTVIAIVLTAMRMPAHFKSDGLISVKRGWRVPEWTGLALQAGIPNPTVWLEHGARITLLARKG
ncbi:MAG TPA: methyltransferase domain-containing protein [Roseimicrobium sp.]|nr:methyltransferase domain-containing protein [Roseimicrobium sp.]